MDISLQPLTSADEVVALIEEHDLHTIEVAVVDLHDTLRGKRIPAAHFSTAGSASPVRAELELGHFVVTEWVHERYLQTS
jgi:glutamine synthetase